VETWVFHKQTANEEIGHQHSTTEELRSSQMTMMIATIMITMTKHTHTHTHTCTCVHIHTVFMAALC